MGSARESIGHSRGGLTSKIHVVTDGFGNAIHFILTVGEIHDSKQAENLLEAIIHENAFVLGDKGNDSDKIIDPKSAYYRVMPPKSNRKIQRKYDKELYKNRNQVERFFYKIKQFRKITTRQRQSRILCKVVEPTVNLYYVTILEFTQNQGQTH